MKRIIILLLAVILTWSASAAFVRNVPVVRTQPNGDTLHLYATGDEYYHRLHDANNYTIVMDSASGYYVYAIRVWNTDRSDWRLIASRYIVGQVDPQAVGIERGIAESPSTVSALRKRYDIPLQYRPAGTDAQGRSISRAGTKNLMNHGTINNVVIFIRFADDTNIATPFSTINAMFNDSSANAISMHNYFWRASYGELRIPTTFYPTPSGNTIISYQDIYPRSYYMPQDTNNPNGYQSNQRASREFSLLERAVNYVNQNYPIPTSLNLDNNNDGLVDNICFIVKGTYTGWSDLLWPHKWSIYDRTVQINGKRVYTFNLQLEGSGSHYFSTSTFCHEMFHTLGAPDLYHYNAYTNVTGAGIWDLMCNNTTPPQHMSMFMKMRYGDWFDTVPEIREAGTYTLRSVGDSVRRNQVYRIQAGNPNQWYYLEYRDNSELFETGLPGSGLIVWRTDTRFNGNANFDASTTFDEVYVFRPNALNDTMPGTASQAFFSTDASRGAFTPLTNPHPWLSGNELDTTLYITNITVAGDSLTFTYTPHRPATHSCSHDNQCTIDVIMSDQYGDTWNGAYVQIETLTGDPVATLGMGDCRANETRTIPVCGEPLQVRWYGGAYPSECSLRIRLGDGTLWTPTNSLENDGIIGVISNPCTNQREEYTLTVLSNTDVGGWVEGSGTYELGTSKRIDAAANTNAHWYFVGWHDGPWDGSDSTIHNTEAHRYVTVMQDSTITAIFDREQYEVSANSLNPTMGTTTGSGFYRYGDSATVYAIPEEGYEFSFWMIGMSIKRANPYTFAVTETTTASANFTKKIGITEVESDVRCRVRENEIIVTGTQNRQTRLYDMQGRELGRGQSSEALQFKVAQPGVYIVQVEGKGNHKVVVLK